MQAMLRNLKAETKEFKKDTVICHAGDTITHIGIVLSGSVQIENNDIWGNKSILDKAGPGAVFAEAYACIAGEPLMVDVVATETTRILFLHAGRLFSLSADGALPYGKVIRNLLMLSAEKNLILSRRIFHTSAKTIRGRVSSYLSFEAARQKSCSFTIPFNRQQLADYLSVDRSALSGELGKMRDEGLICFHKNQFELKSEV